MLATGAVLPVSQVGTLVVEEAKVQVTKERGSRHRDHVVEGHLRAV